MNRKKFLHQGLLGAGSIAAFPVLLAGQSKAANSSVADPLSGEKVKEFVVAGHSKLDMVKSMLQEFPTLIYAAWDWGNGDFETALEGAAHMGNKEIANYLISQGARTNLFVLTMLGKTQLVKAYLNSYPEYLRARGAHGFTLLHHAQKGGEDAKELADYLTSLGLKETNSKL